MKSVVFKPNDLFYFDESDIDRIPYEDRETCRRDFAMGKEKGDYSTIATILKNKQSGRVYVVIFTKEDCIPKSSWKKLRIYP